MRPGLGGSPVDVVEPGPDSDAALPAALLPWLGLGFPLCFVGIPLGLWVLWMTTDPRLESAWT